MSDPLSPRRVAAQVVGRVLRHGAYSNVLLSTSLKDLSTPEASRAKGLVYGTLRGLDTIDQALESGAGRPLTKIDAEITDALRIAAFEICFSEVPDPVAVSVGVDLVREIQPKAAGMANAILRRVAEADSPEEPVIHVPKWLAALLGRFWTREEIDEFAYSSSQEPARVGRLRSGPAGAAKPVEGIPGAFELPPGEISLDFVVQDSASIAVGAAVGAEPGMTVLDLAAAPGGKTMHLLDQVGVEGFVVASDSHRRRTRSAARRFAGAHWVQADASNPPFRPASFDRVLLDAPCSGLGTLRRRPEILIRLEEDTIHQMGTIQRSMLEAAMPLVGPGGRLIYSVCTVTPEETIDVVAGMGFSAPTIPGRDLGEGRLLSPQTTGTDGMFVAEWRP